MNSKNGETSDTLILNLTDNKNFKRSNKYVGLSNYGIHYKQKKMKKSHKIRKFKIPGPTCNDKIILSISSKHKGVSDNLPKRIYINKIEKRITLKIKTRYHLELLIFTIIKLLRSTKDKVIKMKIVRMYLIQKLRKWCQFIVIFSTMITSMIQESCIYLLPIKCLVN